MTRFETLLYDEVVEPLDGSHPPLVVPRFGAQIIARTMADAALCHRTANEFDALEFCPIIQEINFPEWGEVDMRKYRN